jgi:hypothetical protein
MFPLSQINLEDEFFVINYAEQLGLQHRTATFRKQNNQVILHNKFTDFTKPLTQAMKLPENPTTRRKPLLVRGDPGTGKSCAVISWCLHHAMTKSVIWISFKPFGWTSLAIMRQGYILFADLNTLDIKYDFIYTKNFCTLTVIDGLTQDYGKEAINDGIWL